MISAIVLAHRFAVTQDDTEISIMKATRTNERHDTNYWQRNRCKQLNQMIFLTCEVAAIYKCSLTDRLPADPKGLKRSATQDYESSSGSLRGPPPIREGYAVKDIATQMSVFLASVIEITCHITDNKKRTVSPLC